MRPRHRRGFTLIELLVVIAIIAVLVGMLLAAVQKAREAADRAKCQSNIRQMTLACHLFQDANGRLPPLIDNNPDQSTTLHFKLLPYVEQQALFDKGRVGNHYNSENGTVPDTGVPIFICPTDPSISHQDGRLIEGVNNFSISGNGPPAGTSYAANGQIFAKTDHTGAVTGWDGNASLATTFQDGTSNTIMFAEKFGRCGTTGGYGSGGGSAWARIAVQPSTYGPFFEVWLQGPTVKFQVRPLPYTDDNICNFRLASTPHNVMVVSMADGSVRQISPTITAQTWWWLSTPAGGEIVPDF